MPKLTHAQRLEIPKWSLAHNGWGDGSGYPGRKNNPACKYVGHGLEFSCCDGATTTYGKAGLPMVPIQAGMREGAAYVPYLYAHGKAQKGGIRRSWNAEVGDCWLVNTGSGVQPGHIEVVYHIADHGSYVMVWTIGWDSGPSNVDHFRGQGGTHKHVWRADKGTGNPGCFAVVNADVLVDWSKVNDPAHNRHAAKRKKLTPAPLHKTPQGKVTTPPPAPKQSPPWFKRWLRHW